MGNAIKKWWEETSESYQKDSRIPVSIHYGPGSPGETHFKLLGNLKDKRVLELGCGGAQCGIAMAKKGAKVIGVDISREQLKFAEKLAEKNRVKIKFIQGDIKNLKQIKSNSQDIVFTAWALHYIEDLSGCFKEVHRTLKKGGIFVLSLPHPFYGLVNWKTLKLKRTYFDLGREASKVVWPDGSIHYFVSYFYTVSQVINALADAGLVIEKMVEPDSRKKYRDDPWYGKWSLQPKLLKRIPATLIIKARK